MKITKNPNKLSVFERNKIKANVGCDKCPVYGESRTFTISEYGKMFGISNGLYKEFYKGFFSIKPTRIDCYRCYTCGAEWESEPYQWN